MCLDVQLNFERKSMRYPLIISFVFISLVSLAQPSIEDYYDDLTTDWLELSGVIKTYEGLSAFCTNDGFRTYAMDLLGSIHHCDSVVLDFLQEPGTEAILGAHLYRETLKEIWEMELKYSSLEFVTHLKESCKSRNQLEHEKRNLVNETGANGYDGQILLLEADLNKYLKHIDKRIKSMDEYIHKIHPDRFTKELLAGYRSK